MMKRVCLYICKQCKYGCSSSPIELVVFSLPSPIASFGTFPPSLLPPPQASQKRGPSTPAAPLPPRSPAPPSTAATARARAG